MLTAIPGQQSVAGHTGWPRHRTFQIDTFSTELKTHVMVMDFVKNNWFPAQRRAKVCLFHMCQGLPGSQQSASRYEIHSRLLSSPKDPSAWERNESLLNAGFPDHHCSGRDQFALKSLPSDVTERRSDFAKETLASQNTRMLSSIVISRLMENQSKDPGPALPLPCALAQPRACRASAHRSGVSLRRAFAVFPDRLGIPVPSEEPALPAAQSPGAPRKGFASITITARRVRPPASGLVWDAGGDSLCPKCRAEEALRRCPPALASGSHPRQQHGPFPCAEFPGPGSTGRQKILEAQARPCAGRECLATHVEDKDPLVLSSCVQLRVSRPCPKAIYYLDKSLWVPVEQAAVASTKTHRSVLSLSLNCSSHRLTADGVDGTANPEPMSGGLEPELGRPRLDLPGPPWGAAQHYSQQKEKPALEPVYLGTSPCPWSGSPPLGNREVSAAGSHQLVVKKRRGGHSAPHTGAPGNQLSIHIPGWSYRAGDYTCCDLVVKIKECEKKDPSIPKSSPAPPSPGQPDRPQTPDLLEDGFEPQQIPTSSMTLQEALEMHKPHFISRSQERVKRLEHMVQQRKAQQKEKLGQKQSPSPIRISKKQFTVPHPLSDNLFKPKERCISEKEMHMRSKRIYNNLPEVKKKKEEQKKKVILQSNRLRAEVFKKQLLDQLLQRNAV
ncbi:(E2-independent) E3 ubiquitin-conjugating enzyme FATS isoform 4-T4 [Thomomys bottae]